MINQVAFYSPSTNSFYIELQFYPDLPGDLVQISWDRYQEIQKDLTSITHAFLGPDENCSPIIITRPPTSWDPSEAIHENDRARKLLNDTDWYLSRQMETGEAMPSDVKKARENARKILKSDQGK